MDENGTLFRDEVRILPLSLKSGRLCLYEPLPVSDLIFDVFSISSPFFELETYMYIFLQHGVEPCGRTAAKKSVGPKMAVFRPFPRGKKVSAKKKKKKENNFFD